MSRRAHDLLCYAQELLGHRIPSGDIAEVFERALEALIPELEKRKFAATSQPRHSRRPVKTDTRYVPAEVKRAVWRRDQGQCTFRSDSGQRCPSRAGLEFDHMHEFARGGRATVGGMRLRCRAHNQYAAERTFGTDFMRHKRLIAAGARLAAQERPNARAREEAVRAREAAHAREQAAKQAEELDVVPWLRQLGFNACEARRAAALCEDMPHATLEERVRRALGHFRVRGNRSAPASARF